ncbi:MAG: hypothetical protein Q9160_005599 [Pyrenula sp. 1 TL-2023]
MNLLNQPKKHSEQSSSLTGSVAAERSRLKQTNMSTKWLQTNKNESTFAESQPNNAASVSQGTHDRIGFVRSGPEVSEFFENFLTEARRKDHRSKDSSGAGELLRLVKETPHPEKARPRPIRSLEDSADRDGRSRENDEERGYERIEGKRERSDEDINNTDSTYDGPDGSSESDRLAKKSKRTHFKISKEELGELRGLTGSSRPPKIIRTQRMIEGEADARRVPDNIRQDLESWLERHPLGEEDLIDSITTTYNRFEFFTTSPNEPAYFYTKAKPHRRMVPLVCTPAQLHIAALKEYTHV